MPKKQDDSYWLDRGIKQEKKINDAAKQVEQKIIVAYRQAQSYLTRQVRKLFSRAKQRSGMDEGETRALLNQTVQPDELVELRKLADDVSHPELQESARKRLNGLAFKERITRAEDLKAKSFLVSKQIASVQLDKSTEFYIDVIHDSYNETTAETIIRQVEQTKSDQIISVRNGKKQHLNRRKNVTYRLRCGMILIFDRLITNSRSFQLSTPRIFLILIGMVQIIQNVSGKILKHWPNVLKSYLLLSL